MISSDWKSWCRGHSDVTLDGDGVVVNFASGRLHRVEVRDVGNAFALTGFVAGRATLQTIARADLRAWERNRTIQLLGFRIDRRGRLIGESWVPKPGLGADEFLHYIRRMAMECDRFEYILTGKDSE